MSKEKVESQKKRLVIFGLFSVIALVLCTGVVLGVALSLVTEGVYEFDVPAAESLTAMPETDVQTVDFLAKLIDSAKDGKRVYADVSTDIYVENISLDGSESERSVLNYMQKTITANVDAMYAENHTGSFEDGYKGYPTITLSPDEIIKAGCEQGIKDVDGEVTQTDFYFFSLDCVAENYPPRRESGAYSTFGLEEDDKILSALRAEAEPMLTVAELRAVGTEFRIEAQSERLTDRLNYLSFSRKYSVELVVDFAGDFETLGRKTVKFDYTVCEMFNYTWAGISFSEQSVSLEKGDTHQLSLNAVMNDDSDYTMRLESSNEAVATVDDLGYVCGVENSREPVVITAYLEYLGIEYTSECEVTVSVPVKKIEVSEDEMTLGVGQTQALSALLKPDKATNTDVIWISENENVAAVSEDGTVTALKPGTATVIAVAADGHFRDSCTVTVTE